jgi:signal transduction histidine kinase
LTQEIRPSASVARPGKIVVGAVYLLYAAVVIRTFANQNIRPRLPIYLALEVFYLILFTLMLWRPVRQSLWQHLYFVFQSILVLALVLLRPKFDFIVILYVILSLQAVLIFSGRARWSWVAILILLIGIPLIVTLGVLQGLSLALMPMTIGIVFSAYVVVTQEIEVGLRNRHVLLNELKAANQQLTISASQAEELSTMQERNRLARKLHDSVSQTIFSISLHTRATQIMLEREPDRLQSQLEQLQALAHNALEEMRGLIAHLRPQENESAGRTRT